jgi:hypothetical protein
MNLFLILPIFIFLWQIRTDDETWMKEIEFDGVLLKINEKIFEQMMKKVSYALVLFYEDKDKASTDAQDELRLAAETIVQMSPAVGVFKMKCSENPRFCSEMKKEEIPFVIWIINNNFGIYKEPKDRENFIIFCEAMTKFSSIKSLETKEDIAEFLMNTNHYRLLGVFPNENSGQKNKLENMYEQIIPNSLLSNSGEFIFGKVTKKELTQYIYQNFDKSQNSLLIFTKDDLLNFTSIFKLEEDQFQRYKEKFTFISDFTQEKFYPYYLNHTDPTFYDKPQSVINDIIINALPNIFPLDQKFYNLAFGGPIQKHFLLVIHPDHLLNFEILENYNNISKKFREKSHEIWFTFSLFDNDLKDMLKPELMEIQKDEEKDFPILLLFNLKNNEENKKEDIENLERFYLKFHKVNKLDEVRHTVASEPVIVEEFDYEAIKKSDQIEIPKVVGLNFKELVFDFPDNVLVLFLDDDKENTNLYRKWVFLLTKVIKLANSDLLRVYKYNAQLNDNYITQIPHHFPTLKLFIRHNKENPIEYTSGPSLLNIAKFLNELVPLLNLKVSLQQLQEYNQEIFSNADLMEEKILEIDDLGNEIPLNSEVEETLKQRGLGTDSFKQLDSSSQLLNETLKKFAHSDELKNEGKQKYDL